MLHFVDYPTESFASVFYEYLEYVVDMLRYQPLLHLPVC